MFNFEVSESNLRYIDFNHLLSQLESMADIDVRVGYIGDINERIIETENVDNLNNATLAYLHENGSPARKIPARPFLGPSFDENKDNAVSLIAKGLSEVLRQDRPNAQMYIPIFEKVGMFLRDRAKDWIVQQRFNSPLSYRTLEAREAKGFKGEKALIETGQLLNGITYKVDFSEI